MFFCLKLMCLHGKVYVLVPKAIRRKSHIFFCYLNIIMQFCELSKDLTEFIWVPHLNCVIYEQYYLLLIHFNYNFFAFAFELLTLNHIE